jgi:hypothetical protein
MDGNRRMNIPELRRALAALGVQRRAVSIEGVEATEEQYRLERDGGFWAVYYYERGNKNELRHFASEEDACEHFLKIVRNDPTARK